MSKKYILLIIFVWQIFINVAIIRGSVEFNAKCSTAYTKMIALDIKGAQHIINQEKKANPTNLAPLFIENYGKFLVLILNENTNEYEAFLKSSELLLDKFRNEKKENPFNRYFQTDVYLQMAAVHGMQKSYFSTMNAMRKAFSLINDNNEKYPDFVPNLKAFGLLNVMLGSVPSDYSWLLSVMGLSGSVADGLVSLNNLATIVEKKSKWNWLTTEAYMAWNFTNLNFNNTDFIQNPIVLIREEKIDSLAAYNQLLCYSLATFYRHIGDNEKVIKVLENVTVPKDFQRFYYLDYLKAEAMLYKMDSKSLFYFNRYLKAFPGNYFRKSALQKIAWFHLIRNEIGEYRVFMNKILTQGTDFFDEDKKALKEAKKNEIPNKYLLKCRLLFDGGYYEEASRVFQTHNPKVVLHSESEFLEYSYRLGRIYDEWGKDALAISYYSRTIESGKKLPYFFAANSALHLGYLYEREGKKELAKQMYRLCLSMDFDEYRNGITQKAKSGLNRLGED